MNRILRTIGVAAHWLSWPALRLALHFTTRTRVIIISSNNNVLLLKGWLDTGEWTLPGGGLHRGEDPLQGALREVREETSLELQPDNLQHRFTGRVSDHGIGFQGVVYVVHLHDEPGVVPQKGEISMIKWHPLNSLEGLSPLTRQLVDKWSV